MESLESEKGEVGCFGSTRGKMVGLNPAKFYGRLLPRPRIYCDIKFSDARVDPPESVNAALLEWASEASWRMGGTAAKRKRMSGKIEGRMNKLRDMEESDDDEPPPPKKVWDKQPLSFGKKKESPASELSKQRTPIERMMESPGSTAVSKRGKLAPRRIISSAIDDDGEVREPVAKLRARRRRNEQAIKESDDDSEEDLEGFLQKSEHTPNRNIRRSTRLQASPTLSLTPDSRNKTSKNGRESGGGRKSSLRSPLSFNRKRYDEDPADSEPQESESVFL